MPKARVKMWAVKRDAYIYVIYPNHGGARKACEALCLEGHSKHKWSVAPVYVLVQEDAR